MFHLTKISFFRYICSIMSKAYILLANGFETIEALTPADVLRRCGVEVKLVSVSGLKMVSSSHKVALETDISLSEDLSDGDMVILPGGYPGYTILGESTEVGKVVKEYYEKGKYIAAICAAPSVLLINDIAKGKNITCHSCVVEEMSFDYHLTGEGVVEDGKLITGKGAGWSLPFALKLAEKLASPAAVAKVRKGLELD